MRLSNIFELPICGEHLCCTELLRLSTGSPQWSVLNLKYVIVENWSCVRAYRDSVNLEVPANLENIKLPGVSNRGMYLHL